MLHPRDFYRAATYLMDLYGPEAGYRAANRAAELRVSGDMVVQSIWEILAATVREIEKQRPEHLR